MSSCDFFKNQLNSILSYDKSNISPSMKTQRKTKVIKSQTKIIIPHFILLFSLFGTIVLSQDAPYSFENNENAHYLDQQTQNNWYRDAAPPPSSVVNSNYYNGNSENYNSQTPNNNFSPNYISRSQRPNNIVEQSPFQKRSQLLPSGQHGIAFYQPNQNLNFDFNDDGTRYNNEFNKNEGKKSPVLLIGNYPSFNNEQNSGQQAATFPYIPLAQTAATPLISNAVTVSLYSNRIAPPSITPEIYGKKFFFIII